MQPLATLGLANAAEHQAYLDELASSHQPRFTADLLNLDDQLVASIPMPEDASVTGSNTDQVSRMLTGSLFDPEHTANIDTASPGDGTLPLDRIIRIQHHVDVPALGRTVTATPFYGWLTKADRKGDYIQLEGSGLQRRAMFGQQPITVRAGAGTVNSITTILNQRYGETRFRVPSGHPARLPKNVTTGWEDEVAGWPICTSLGRSIGHLSDYSCDGWFTLRTPPTNVAMTFRITEPGGVGANMTSEPEMTSDALAIRNISIKRGKGAVAASAAASPNHPLSAQQQARHGKPFYMPITEQNDAYASNAAAARAAQAQLADLLREVSDIGFTALPVYHLDLDDIVRVITPDYTLDARITGFTLPLDGSDMTINRKVWVPTPRKAVIRA